MDGRKVGFLVDPPHTLVLTLVAMALACSPDVTPPGEVSRDSAGIAIREYSAAPPTGEHASLRADEIVSIGAVEGDETETFNRISDLATGSDGRLHVLDGGDQIVDVYDRDGKWVLRYGGQGEGPAEFLGASLLIPWADSMAVYDYRNQKLALFASDGSLLATRHWELPIFGFGFPSVLAPVPGGLIGVFETGCSMPPPEDRRPAWKLFMLEPNGALEDTVAIFFPGSTLAVYGDRFCMAISALAGADYELAVREDGFAAFTAQREYEIAFMRLRAREDYEGKLPTPDRIVRRRVDPSPVTSAEVEAWRERHLTVSEDLDSDDVKAIRRAMDTTAVPENHPRIDALLWGDDGRLWVGRTVVGDDPSRTWDVYDGEGRLVAEAVLPANLGNVLVQDDMVWGTVRDELGVMYVKGFRLEERVPASDR